MGTLDNMVAQAVMAVYAEARREDLISAHDRTQEAFSNVLFQLGYYTPLENAYDQLIRLYKKTDNQEMKKKLYHDLTVLKEALGVVHHLGLEEKRDEHGRRYPEDTE